MTSQYGIHLEEARELHWKIFLPKLGELIESIGHNA